MSTVKIPLSYENQIIKIKEKGCIVDNDDYCLEVLKNIGYYRLSAYFLPFTKDNSSQIDFTFKNVCSLYEFDRELRNLLFETIEVIEIKARTIFSNCFAFKYGPLGYKSDEVFNSYFNREKFNLLIESQIENNKNRLFVKHHLEKYDGEFPIWVLMELFTFGMLSKFYNDLHTADKKEIAKLFNTNYKKLGSWLRCCTDLRNICAHYDRLYFKIFAAKPRGLELHSQESSRLWGQILMLKNLYPHEYNWNNIFIPKIISLMNEYKLNIDLRHIGFPNDWLGMLQIK